MHLLLPYFWTNVKTGESFDISSFESYTNISNMVQFIAIKNPFIYRSYYYDFETGRFINADDIDAIDVTKITTNGLNLYAYCLNNPVNGIDESRYILLTLLIGALIGAVVGFATSVITQGLTIGWNNINWGVVLLDTLFGAIGGVVSASPLGLLGQMLIGGLLSTGQYIGGQLIRGEEITDFGILFSFGLGAIFSFGDGLLAGKMPGKNIPKTVFVKQIQQQTSELFKKSVSKALSHYTKHVFNKLLYGYMIDAIQTGVITSGINIVSYWSEYLINKLF